MAMFWQYIRVSQYINFFCLADKNSSILCLLKLVHNIYIHYSYMARYNVLDCQRKAGYKWVQNEVLCSLLEPHKTLPGLALPV